jgi:hypothetical protein
MLDGVSSAVFPSNVLSDADMAIGLVVPESDDNASHSTPEVNVSLTDKK